jgi:hypothetical protein
VWLDHITPSRFIFAKSLLQKLAAAPGGTSQQSLHLIAPRWHISPSESQTLLRPNPMQAKARYRDLCFHRLPGGYSSVVPPDPIPNSEVKRARADGSVA